MSWWGFVVFFFPFFKLCDTVKHFLKYLLFSHCPCYYLLCECMYLKSFLKVFKLGHADLNFLECHSVKHFYCLIL